MNIEQLLAEREKTHGDPEQVYSLVCDLREALHNHADNMNLKCKKATVTMLDEILLKIGRGLYNPQHEDNWLDCQGYSKLIHRIECGGDSLKHT